MKSVLQEMIADVLPVSACVAEWIEIAAASDVVSGNCVSACVAEWIEIKLMYDKADGDMSPPVWRSGLKSP